MNDEKTYTDGALTIFYTTEQSTVTDYYGEESERVDANIEAIHIGGVELISGPVFDALVDEFQVSVDLEAAQLELFPEERRSNISGERLERRGRGRTQTQAQWALGWQEMAK